MCGRPQREIIDWCLLLPSGVKVALALGLLILGIRAYEGSKKSTAEIGLDPPKEQRAAMYNTLESCARTGKGLVARREKYFIVATEQRWPREEALEMFEQDA